MSYKRAADVLPQELIDRVQDYVDGAYVYIPRREEARRAWGESTGSKQEIARRNSEIFWKYTKGMSVARLSEAYYLSPKSLQKIIARMKSVYR